MSSDNIKSVPLKALLAAYPQYFVVRGNQVSSIRDDNASSYYIPSTTEVVIFYGERAKLSQF